MSEQEEWENAGDAPYAWRVAIANLALELAVASVLRSEHADPFQALGPLS